MKKIILSLLLPLVLVSWLRGLPAGVTSIAFSTSQAQFAAGDVITIQEVFASSANLAPGDVVVVRGTYTLQSRAAAIIGLSLTTSGPSGPTPVSPLARSQIAAGSGTFELEYSIQQVGSMHVTFSPTTSGSSFGGVYFAGTAGSGTPSTPATPLTPVVTPPVINPVGVSSVPFVTSQAKFETGDAITITEVRASSPNLAPGDVVVVRGSFVLQSRTAAVLMISLTSNAPGATEVVASNSRMTVAAGTGTFELAYEVKQPGALHVTFYPAAGGSSFGGVYFAAPGAAASAGGAGGVAVTNPTTNVGKLGNLSIRSLVGPGEGVLVAGLTVTEQERYVVIRGVGPSLNAFGLSNFLRKPVLTVYNASGEVVATAGGWGAAYSGDQRAGIVLLMNSVGAFPLTAGSDDAVLNLRLLPGGYTVSVAPGDGQSGVALLEIYASSTFSLPLPR